MAHFVVVPKLKCFNPKWGVKVWSLTMQYPNGFSIFNIYCGVGLKGNGKNVFKRNNVEVRGKF
jgi:hypothetical protein